MISLANAVALDVRKNGLVLSQLQGKLKAFRFMLRPALCRGRTVSGQ
jgi:hypothetical protein